ncbi:MULTISPECIES: P-loop NTPase fold protein [Veillonella]|jgi:P-loop ATPase|uniref:KAP family P-loop NTPase fold protein n=1 Tax=Veillonella TaxID=29465 RepID=UPI002913F57E|nr:MULTISPECIES: P-loop NTPase fold protein [Veillonella]MDU6865357.1 P-loop NTPase fold protein [Veillonella sp.]MDU6912532.1 P-loop NTPase fold protein [Veillonella sp.]MDU6948902.1 P-loop NTPase fold protein [Veillonella parvula]
MNYNSDKAIESLEQDLLGRVTFSKQLGEAIYKYDGKDGLVLGVFGKWGTGKTSILNMVVNEINCLSDNDDDSPIIVNFSPWNYTDKDNLISLFFRVLKNRLDMDKYEETRKKIGKALTDYSDALDALALVPMVGSGLATILKTIAKAQGAELSKDVDIDTTKENLETVLGDTNQKIVVIIDDIDRLTNTQIRDIFQLVKQVGNFPNIIYVLSMDREVVCRALESVHNIDGAKYLEKIVQIPFEIPALLKPRLRELFLTKLENTIKAISDNPKIDQSYWSEVFTNCIEPYIETLRDVNRVINTFQFRYKILYAETAFEDMVALTTIEVLEPQLYQWIGRNKDLLCSTYSHSFSALFRDKSDYRTSIYEELKKLGINTDIGIKFLSTLFPVFANDIDERDYRYTESNIRETMRVAQEERFDSYFMFDLREIPVTRYVINDCINKMALNDLITTITVINNDGNIEYFIDELRSLVDTIPEKRLGLLSSVILNVLHKFSQNSQFYMLSAYTKAEFLVYDIISKINDENERYNLIKSVLENIDKEQIGTLASFINRIELSYGRLAGKEEHIEKQLITLQHLIDIELIYVSKINEITQSEVIIDIRNFYMAFYLWECLDKDRAQNYLDNILKEDNNILKFICAIASKWTSDNNTSGWDFPLDKYLTYISKDAIYEKIQEFDKRQLDTFTLENQIKLASFVLNYERSDHHNVNEKEAMKRVNDWKANKN